MCRCVYTHCMFYHTHLLYQGPCVLTVVHVNVYTMYMYVYIMYMCTCPSLHMHTPTTTGSCSENEEHFTFVLTDLDSKYRFGFCLYRPKGDICMCIIRLITARTCTVHSCTYMCMYISYTCVCTILTCTMYMYVYMHMCVAQILRIYWVVMLIVRSAYMYMYYTNK